MVRRWRWRGGCGRECGVGGVKSWMKCDMVAVVVIMETTPTMVEREKAIRGDGGCGDVNCCLVRGGGANEVESE